MALVALLGSDPESRRSLTLAIEEMGHRVCGLPTLEAMEEALSGQRPQLLVVACEEGSRQAELALAEADRLSPLLPVIVALERRDASRAVELMLMGACEVVPPPWTRENLSACVAKALRSRGTGFEPVLPKAEIRRSRLAAALLGALLMAAGFFSWSAYQRRLEAMRPQANAWDLPTSHPSGLAYREGELWVSDWFSQSVYRYDARRHAWRRAVFFPKETPMAMTLSADALWLVSTPGLFTKHMLDERLTALSKLADSHGPTVALAFDGLYLWSVDRRARRMHKRLLDGQLTVLASYAYPGVEPAALAFDGKGLWSLDAANRELLRHELEDPRIVTRKLPLPEYASGLWRPRGLAFDGASFWSVAEGKDAAPRPGRLFRHRLPSS